jgi:hypothetical protein
MVRLAGERLDQLFDRCEGYPEPARRDNRSRYRYLRDHDRPAAAFYVNTTGRSVRQVREEAKLRDAIERFLDASGCEWGRMSATEARRAIVEFVGRCDDLAWAREPEPPRPIRERLDDAVNFATGIGLVTLAAPFLALASPALAFMLRRRERTDPAPRLIPTDAHRELLASVEDIHPQNQFTAAGQLKPGRFRRYTAAGVLWAVNFGIRHFYNRGVLSGVRTIHFARWVFFDDHRRLLFASNYDGSLENYMDDFIDKVAWGLNAVFSNGNDYPRTSWLVLDGARDELAFKSYIRTRQLPTPVWYSAYPDLTTVNIENNAAIRAGLSGSMDEAAAAAWLRRF